MSRVLVVDDNRDLGELTSEILEERGFRVNIAFDGETALVRVKQEPYDLMILDYRLPGISGLIVLEKTQQIRPTLKTIMISAYGNESVRSRAEELGAYDFLDKPFDIDRLVRVVKKALRGRQRRCISMKHICTIGVLVLLLMNVLVLPVFAAGKVEVVQQAGAVSQTAGQLTVLEPAKLALAKLSGYLPKLGGLLLILVVGSLIAVGIAALVGGLLKLIRLEKGAKKINVPQILKKGGIGLSLSELIIEIIFFLLIIATLITALEFYGLATSPFSGQILSYLPHVIAAMFILILGILLAILISGIITLVGGNVRIAQSALLGNIAKYAIIVVAGSIALRELGLGVILTDKAKDIILAGLVLGFALAFGLGAKEKAAKFLNKIFKE